jgi:hypothetical protein
MTKIDKDTKFVCKRCGYENTLQRMLMDALLMEAGAIVIPSPIRCPDGKRHDLEMIENDKDR